jgi:pimeloyl-ACP methyl ester carboxylesterase
MADAALGYVESADGTRLAVWRSGSGPPLCFFRDVVRAPETELAVLQNHPAWPARVAAAHTIVREADAEEGFGLDLGRFEQLTVPTLLIVGGASPDHFREAAARLHAVISGSRIHVLPGQQHIAMDTAPEQFIDAVCLRLADDANDPACP